MNKLSILVFMLIFGCTKNEFKIKDKVFSLDEFKTLVKQEDITEYLLKNEYDLKQKLEENKETILHVLLEKKLEAEAIILLDKLKELEQEERDEFLKRKNEKGDEALYTAIDNGNTEILKKILELYSEKARNQRLCFEYYEDTILDRAVKNRNAKVMIDLVELKEKYRPEDLEKRESNKVQTEIVITDILDEIKRIIEEQEEAFESGEILLNEEEQKESIILKLIEENMEKKQEKEEVIKKFKKLIKEKREEVLILASYLGDKGVIERYIEEREENTKDKDERTILMLASQQGHREVVELLLSKGASIDLANKNGWTPLFIASRNEHKEVVELLLTKGAAIDLADNIGWTPLFIASQEGHKELVELLLTKGAAIDLVLNNGATLLIIASYNGHKEVVELLLSKGAAIDLARNDGSTPLLIASHNGHTEVVELLLTKGAAIDLGNKNGATPLFIASQLGKKEVVELLLTKGAAIDLENSEGITPLLIASCNGHKEVVEQLLSNGAAIDLTEKDGWTPLMIASENGHKEVVELLLTKEAAINLAMNDGCTPLIIASQNGHKEVVELLLTKGAAINLAINDGCTPLIIASQNGHKEVVELLLTKGASIDLANKYGVTPLFIASQEGKKEVVELLLSKDASVDLDNKYGRTPLIIASYQGHKEVVELLITKGAAIDLVDEYGQTPLLSASENGHKEVVELLLSKGASIDLANKYGVTQLLRASERGRKEVVELLLSNEANPNTIINEYSNETILIWSIKKNLIKIINLLIEKGANVDLALNDGKTPLMIAHREEKKEIVELLLTKGANPNTIIDKYSNETILIWSIKKSLIEIINLLIEKGANVDLALNDGRTPLMIAHQEEKEKIVEILIKNGANPNTIIDKYSNETILIWSIKKSLIEIINLLIEKGVNVDLALNDGRTPLMMAHQEDKKEIVEILIKNGANPNTIIDKNNNITILIWSIKKELIEITNLLVEKGADVDLGISDGRTPLIIASQEGKKEAVELLIKSGAKIDKADNNNISPLVVASNNGYKEITTILIRNGAIIQKSDPKFEYDQSKIVEDMVKYFYERSLEDSSWCFTSRILLQKEFFNVIEDLANFIPFAYLENNFFNISQLNFYGYNSLYFAVLQNDTQILKKLLLDNNIKELVNSFQAKSNNKNREINNDPNNIERDSCIAFAFQRGKLEHVKVLLSYGASPIYYKYSLLRFISRQFNVLDTAEIKDYVSNRLIFDALKEERTEDASKLLFGHLRLEKRVQRGSKEVNVLADLEPEINNFSYKNIINLRAIDEEGKNVFHYLAIYGKGLALSEFLNRSLARLPNMKYEIVSFTKELLFEYDNSGYTPFHYALLNSNEDFVEAFLRDERIEKENINKLTKDGMSVFDLIEKLVSKEVVTLLIKYLWSVEKIESLYASSKVRDEDREIYFLIKESTSREVNKKRIKINNVCQIVEESISEVAIEGFNSLELSEADLVRAVDLAIIFSADKCLKVILKKLPERELKARVTSDLIIRVCKENKEGILALLIEVNKENTVIQDSEGNTPLHYACIEKQDGIVRELLKHEIVRKNIDIQNKLGNTAMHNAHISLSSSIITELKGKGADINIKNRRAKRGIDLIRDRDTLSNEENIKLGSIYASLTAMLEKEHEWDYEQILHLAIEAREYWVINDLVSYGYINSRNEDGDTPLHFALKNDRKEAIDMLLNKRANFLEKNKKKETAISLVKNRDELMKIIQKAIEHSGMSSKYLLGIADEEGNTLLHLVVKRARDKSNLNLEDRELIKAILDNGANKDKVNKEGRAAIDLAGNNEPLRKLLNEHIPNLEGMIRREEDQYKQRRLRDEESNRNKLEEEETIAVLHRERRHDIDLSSGRRAIHLIVERDDEFALIELLQNGSDPDWEDKERKNCYEIAKEKSSINAFKILLREDILNRNIFEEKGEHASPFYIGVEKGGQFFSAVLKRLKEECEKGYEIHKLRELKHNPIEKIIKLDNLDMIKKLIELGLEIEDREKESPLINRLISMGSIMKIIEDDNPDMLDKLIKVGLKLTNIKELIFKSLSKSKIKVFKYLLNKLENDETRKEALKNWQDIMMMHDLRTENEFRKEAYRLLLQTEDIFEESVNGISAIHLGIMFRNDLFEIIFEKLKESQDKINWAKIRENKIDLNDPIKELVNKDDVDLLSKLIEELGLEIVDKYGHNLLIEAIQVKSKKIFEYLVPKVDKQEAIMNKFRYESSALEIAQLRNGPKAEVKDNYYLSLLSKRLEELDEEEREKVNEELKEVLEGNIHINAKLSNRQPALHTVIRFFEVSKVVIERLEREKRSKERVQDLSLVETESALVEENRKKDELKEKIKVLIEKQANPSLEDKYENNCYELANDEEIFEMLIRGKDIYEEKAKESGRGKHGSIIFLSVQKGLKVFETVFKRLEAEYLSENLDITKLRDLEFDPLSEIIKTYNVEMLKRLMSIGQIIVDKNRNNILTEAIVQKQRIIFDHLIEELKPGNREFPDVRDVKIIRDVISKEYRVKINGEWRDRTAETEARIINSSDSYYHEGINRKLKMLSIMIEK